MIDYLKAAGGEASLLTRLGFWRQVGQVPGRVAATRGLPTCSMKEAA